MKSCRILLLKLYPNFTPLFNKSFRYFLYPVYPVNLVKKNIFPDKNFPAGTLYVMGLEGEIQGIEEIK